MKKLFLIPLMACFTCMAFATEKFYLGVTNEGGDQVAMSITDGLTLHFNVPASGVMNEDALALKFRMNDVPVWGITSQHAKTYNLDLNLSGNANIQQKLSSLYGFEGSKMLVSVKANGASQSFYYTWKAYNAGEVQATPNAVNESMAFWYLFADQFNMTTNASADKIAVKGGSYIQFGKKKLSFKVDCDLDVNFWSDANLAKFTDAANTSLENAEDADIVVYMKEGSTMYMGTKAAQLKQDMTVTLKDGPVFTSAGFENFYNATPSTSIKGFATMVNELFAYVDGAAVTELTINFGGDLEPQEADLPTPDEPIVLRSGVATNRYSTICLPYGATSLEGAAFYEIDYKEGTTLYMVEVTALQAGKPYIFSATQSTIQGMYTGAHVDDPVDGLNGLYGVFESQTINNPGGNLYGFSNNKLKKLASPCLLPANRAYVDLSEVPASSNIASNRPRKAVAIEEVATGLDEMQVELEGTKKMVVNGQLIILRDGVKYNAQGAVIE